MSLLPSSATVSGKGQRSNKEQNTEKGMLSKPELERGGRDH